MSTRSTLALSSDRASPDPDTRAPADSSSIAAMIRQAVGMTVALGLLCCVVYPGVVTGIAQAAFADRAEGSLVTVNGAVRGSELLGQTFADPSAWPEYFWGRPSAASADANTGVLYSSGSNYGPLNPALKDEVEARVKALRDTGVTGPIPVDLVTKSGSGLDPHISPAAAEIQVARVAKARSMPEAELRGLVAANTDSALFGFIGEPRVNVLKLNLALDAKKAPPPERAAARASAAAAAASAASSAP